MSSSKVIEALNALPGSPLAWILAGQTALLCFSHELNPMDRFGVLGAPLENLKLGNGRTILIRFVGMALSMAAHLIFVFSCLFAAIEGTSSWWCVLPYCLSWLHLAFMACRSGSEVRCTD